MTFSLTKWMSISMAMFGSLKIWEKMQRKENRKEKKSKGKIKNRVKDDKLFLFATSNSFYLF